MGSSVSATFSTVLLSSAPLPHLQRDEALINFINDTRIINGGQPFFTNDRILRQIIKGNLLHLDNRTSILEYRTSHLGSPLFNFMFRHPAANAGSCCNRPFSTSISPPSQTNFLLLNLYDLTTVSTPIAFKTLGQELSFT